MQGRHSYTGITPFIEIPLTTGILELRRDNLDSIFTYTPKLYDTVTVFDEVLEKIDG